MYPKNDSQFEETNIVNVNSVSGGWEIKREDGFSFFVQEDFPIAPEVGMIARFYGKGIGYSVRGLFINGERVFYRTEEEGKEKREIDLYGIDAKDWLKRWDEGKGVWSIEMGGIGPGYEQAIQITVAEILRHLLDNSYSINKWGDTAIWEKDRKQIEEMCFANERISSLRLSCAQWGSALHLAIKLYNIGPRAIMADEQVKDRRILVSKNFP